MALFKILTSVVVKILFGPWFYLDKHIPDIQRISMSPKQLLLITITASVSVIWLRADKLKQERTRPLHERMASRVFYSCVWLVFLGSFANSIVMMANNSRVPVFDKGQHASYAKSGNLVIDKRHSIGNADTNLYWLSDYINSDSSVMVSFIYPKEYVSPGDLAFAASFILYWWLLIAITVSALVRHGGSISHKAQKGPN